MPDQGNSYAVELDDVGVRFVVPTERIRSFKEYMLRRLKNQIRHRDFWALKSVSLKISPGEVFGIVGRNGAGKSTLLKVVSRVLRPTEGRVVLRGVLAPMLELGAGFHPDLNGRENVILNATILGIPRAAIHERLPEVIGFSELEGFIDSPIRTYSSGMLARLGFSVATLFRPDILVLDEVLAVGDLGFQKKCLDRIQSFLAEGTTVLLVSHSPATLQEYCGRIAWIDHGEVQEIGPPEAVLPHYQEAVA